MSRAAHGKARLLQSIQNSKRFRLPPFGLSAKPPSSDSFIERNLMNQLLLESVLAVRPVNVLLAQASNYQTPAASAPSPISTIIGLAICVLIIAAMWKVFTKAGHPGWACLIPIYNIYVLCKIAGRPGWWLLLMLIPLVNFIIAIILCIDIAKSFGKGVGFALGMVFLGFIFWPILGFGSAQYHGPSAGGGTAVAAAP